MSNDEMRIAIAVDQGWSKGAVNFGSPTNFEWNKIENGENRVTYVLPNYPENLNVMHEVWGILDRKERISFSQTLREVVVNAGGHATSFNEDIVACCENATAHQRAEAYLRVKGLWNGPIFVGKDGVKIL